MKEHKVIENKLKWHPQKSTLLFPCEPETRKPLLWLASLRGAGAWEGAEEIYLVNLTDETLDYVQSGSTATALVDDDIYTSGGVNYRYEHVKPGDAVKIEEYDGFYDRDYLLNIVLKIKSKSLGCLQIATPSKKGGIREMVLLWDTNEYERKVSVSHI